jgi:hypothetical protein
MFTPIFSPLDYFLQTAKQKHEQNVKEYFKLLETHSKVNREENAQTVARYNEKQAQIKSLQANVSGNKTKRTLLIIGIVILWIVSIAIFANLDILPAIQAMLIAFTLGLSIFGIVKVCKHFNAAIRILQSKINELQAQANVYYQEASKQAEPLNALFTNEDSLRLFQKTLPFITFDERLLDARLHELSRYGFSQAIENDACVLDTLSGELYGNPFLYLQKRLYSMGTQTYHGSLTISWTTRETDRNGNTKTVSHTQTLHASIVRPKPYYSTDTALYFGNDEVPNVAFSRTYKHAEDKSESALNKTIKSGEKKIRRLQEERLKNDDPTDDFVGTVNTEFDVLFNALNRTDDYEFREMFTPRAQESMVQLLLYSDGYGDDFSFSKQGKLCTIRSEHSQLRALSPRAEHYYSHDIAQIESSFVQENEEFFRGVYFDFAPLLLIPPYQQPLIKSERIVSGEPTAHTYETLAYRSARFTEPDGAQTPSLYKTALTEKSANGDFVAVIAYSFAIQPRVHYEGMYGRDGRWHNVPVHWDEYIPLHKQSLIRIVKADSEKDVEKGGVYHRGYAAYPEHS